MPTSELTPWRAKATDELLEALLRTVDAGAARVALESTHRSSPPPPMPNRQAGQQSTVRGLLGRAAEKGFAFFIKGVLKAVEGKTQQAEGLVDFPSRRCAVDWGCYAELIDGPRRWSGRSGRPIATLDEQEAQAFSPLWLVDLLRGVNEASEVGSELVRGRPCRRFSASADLARVSAAVPDDTALPVGSSFEDLRELPVEVWLDDDGYVRRIRFEYSDGVGGGVQTAELFDLGTKEPVDWSRLPVFKDP